MTTFASAPVAVIDVGSVSCQLLITDGTTRLRRSMDTLLGGASMTTTGTVSGRAVDAAGLDRLRAALDQHRAAIDEIGVGDRLRVVTTSVGRRATNVAELIDVVTGVVGVAPEVIDGETEARLAFAGAVGEGRFTAEVDDPVLTVDVGGGSTDLAFGSAVSGTTGLVSLPVGGDLLTSAYFDSDPPRPEELSAALSVVELHLDDVRRDVPALMPALETVTVIGLGAVVTLAAIEIGLADVDPLNGDGDGPLDGFQLERDALEDVFRTIATENREDRAFNPGLPPTRVDGIVGACAIVAETMRQFDLDAITVSQRGLVDGVASEMLTAVG
ncbi:MAG: hypothetical protein AAF962_20465 [Actinomycetota bacterium]